MCSLTFGRLITSHSLLCILYTVVSCCHLQSLADPFDPVLSSLRAAGVIMPPQVCYERLGNPDLPAIWDVRVPIALASETVTWVEAIRTAIQTNATDVKATPNVSGAHTAGHQPPHARSLSRLRGANLY